MKVSLQYHTNTLYKCEKGVVTNITYVCRLSYFAHNELYIVQWYQHTPISIGSAEGLHLTYKLSMMIAVSSTASDRSQILTSISSEVCCGRVAMNHGGLLNEQHMLVLGQSSPSHRGSLKCHPRCVVSTAVSQK